MGADFKMEPDELARCDFVQRMHAVVVASDSTTARSGPGRESKLDYFVVDVELARAVKEVRVRDEVAFHPHRPVELILAERPADLAYMDFDTPPQIPKVKRIFPLQETSGIWQGYGHEVREIMEAVDG